MNKENKYQETDIEESTYNKDFDEIDFEPHTVSDNDEEEAIKYGY